MLFAWPNASSITLRFICLPACGWIGGSLRRVFRDLSLQAADCISRDHAERWQLRPLGYQLLDEGNTGPVRASVLHGRWPVYAHENAIAVGRASE
jgi:hypothetical protein